MQTPFYPNHIDLQFPQAFFKRSLCLEIGLFTFSRDSVLLFCLEKLLLDEVFSVSVRNFSGDAFILCRCSNEKLSIHKTER